MLRAGISYLLAGSVATAISVICLGAPASGTNVTATPVEAAQSTTSTPCPLPSPCYSVMTFGAKPDGISDNTAAFSAAIGAAQSTAGGGTVYVPSGTYAFTQALNGIPSVRIKSNSVGSLPPVTLVGDGAATTALVEHVPAQPLLHVDANGSTVEGLTLDARTYGGGPDVTVAANNTTVTQDDVLGAYFAGVIGGGRQYPWALFYAGPPGATQDNPAYHYGNTVSNTSIVDGINNDGFSFSYQSGGTISNIQHFGSRLALYVDQNVTVTNYSYTPNPQCLGAENGFWITAPSSNIVIDRFTTAGEGGVINGPTDRRMVSNVTINNETFTSPSGEHLEAGNVNGLTIENSSYNSDNTLLLNPNGSATGITVENTSIARVVVARYLGSAYSQVSANFNGDTFLPLTSGPTFTYPLPAAPGPTALNIDGGSWSQSGRFYRQAATNVSFTVTNLAPIAVSPPTISGTHRVGVQLSGSNGGWLAGQTPVPTYTYQWDEGSTPITNATSNSYVPTAPGSYLLQVTATSPAGSTTVTSSSANVR